MDNIEIKFRPDFDFQKLLQASDGLSFSDPSILHQFFFGEVDGLIEHLSALNGPDDPITIKVVTPSISDEQSEDGDGFTVYRSRDLHMEIFGERAEVFVKRQTTGYVIYGSALQRIYEELFHGQVPAHACTVILEPENGEPSRIGLDSLISRLSVHSCLETQESYFTVEEPRFLPF